jgi:hypothetical protein
MHFVNMNDKKQRIWGMRGVPDAAINVRGGDTERGEPSAETSPFSTERRRNRCAQR